MKSVLDASTRAELINRINSLDETSTALWGEMNVSQMIKHCTLWDEMILHNIIYKRVFIGRILGKLMLRKELKDDSPLRRNSTSIPELVIVKKNGDVATQKKEWIAKIEDYAHLKTPPSPFVHPFFGPMTKEQIGFFAFKHTDHHLRQFGA